MELPTQDEILKLISIIQRKTQMYFCLLYTSNQADIVAGKDNVQEVAADSGSQTLVVVFKNLGHGQVGG